MNIISIRRVGMLLLLVLLVAVPMTTVAGGNDTGKLRVFVEYAAGHKGAVRSALARAGGQFHYDFEALNSFVVSLPEAALKGIERNPNVVSVEEDAPRYLAAAAKRSKKSTQSDTLTEQVTPYGVTSVQAPDVWGEGYTGAGRTVCIIDTGYYADHEDLPGGDDDDSDQLIGGTSQVDDNYLEDGYGHGSHVAGTIAGMDNEYGVVGVAPGVDLYIVKIFANDGSWVTRSSDLIDAAYTCADNGANVISMSLGGGQATRKEEKAFATLYGRGVLSIAAAGNDGNEAYSYPASYPSVVSVAAIDEDYAVADFSQFNDAVELAAPGVGVLSTIPYVTTDELVVDGVTYDANGIEYTPYGTASGLLVDGGLCDATGDYSGMVVLCQRGDISFYDKVMNVEDSGGVAAVIYNNVEDNFYGTLGDGNTSGIPAISLSMEDGETLVANSLGSVGEVTHLLDYPADGYEAWDGTSMATPHVSAVAALIWSANTGWTNAEVRDAMTATALDLGDPEYDVNYGYGLVQALGALDYLNN